ncbi:MAG: methyltransferase domain-containing protein [Acidobacteriota bacterium]
MANWRPDQYLLFEEERTRPCRDLAGRVAVEHVQNAIDLGCGTGTSTSVLCRRWPDARISGLDSSSEMLERARRDAPQGVWIHGDIAAWSQGDRDEYDVVFSNAALHWVQDHAAVYPRLFARVASGGALAVQVPYNLDSPAHVVMRDLASSETWRARFPVGGVRQWFVHEAGFYYDLLAAAASRIDIWKTTYMQVMPNVEAIAEWYKGTGMRPFLDALESEAVRAAFISDYVNEIRAEYPVRTDGHVLFPFRRQFLIAAR